MEIDSVMEGDFTKFLPEEVVFTIFAKLIPVDLCRVATVSTEVIIRNLNHIVMISVAPVLCRRSIMACTRIR
jgi:hypothetical protein